MTVQANYLTLNDLDISKAWNAFREKYTSQEVNQIDEIVLQNIFKTVLEEQKKLIVNQAVTVSPSETFPYPMVIRQHDFQVIHQKAGEGTYSEVFGETFFPTKHTETQSPSKPKKRALKVAKNIQSHFSPEKKKIDRMLSSRSSSGIDYPIETFKLLDGTSCSLHKYFDHTLNGIRYETINKPVEYVIKILLETMKGIRTIHDAKSVHRDIKGANILVQKDTGAITDFGFLMEEKSGYHDTLGTDLYLDPKSYGSAGQSIVNQRKRQGIQTCKNDLYAFGRVIELDVLEKLLPYLGSKFNKTADILEILNEIKPLLIYTSNSRPFSDKRLEDFGEKFPYRAIYQLNYSNGQENLCIMEKVEDRKSTLDKAIGVLEGKGYPKDAAETLYELVALSMELQEINHNLTANHVYDRIANLHSRVLQQLNHDNDQKKADEQTFLDEILNLNETEASYSMVEPPRKRQKTIA